METNKIFEALPNVKAIWITEDGEYHLNPYKGGEKVERGQEGKAPSTPKAKAPSAQELIDAINLAENEEQVLIIVGEDGRKTVKDAADAKIASFTV